MENPDKHPALPLHRMRVYNPGRMTDVEIELAFVARRDTLQRILQDVTAEEPNGRPQHHLIIGQRGMGKTTLLLRIAAALRSEQYRHKFIPLVFAEEQYSVDRLSRFWLNCLDALADSCERERLQDDAERIDRIISDLPRSAGSTMEKDHAAAVAALDAFMQESATLNRRPVLLVDNLQMVFSRTVQQQHEFRETLMRPGAPIVVAAAPQRPPELDDYGAAFYDQFKSHYLRPLTADGMREVMLSLADQAGRNDIRQHIVQNFGRLQALHQLTGGNPRTTVLLFHLYAEDCSPSVADDLEKLLDDVTALYKARFEDLPHQQQLIVSAIAEHWDPVDSRTLCQTTGLAAGKVSSQLDRLMKTGVIEDVELYGTTRRGYQLAERFFNVWFLMRHASRRQRRQIAFLTRFLETLYEPTERESIARQMSLERGMSRGRMLMSLAVADTLVDCPLKSDLTRNTQLEALEQQRRTAQAEADRLLNLKDVSNEVQEFDQLRNRLRDRLGIELSHRVLGDWRFLTSGRREQLAARAAFSDDERALITKELESNRVLDEKLYSPETLDWLAERMSSGQLCSAVHAAEWERAIDAADHHAERIRMILGAMPESVAAQLTEKTQDLAARILQPTADADAEEFYQYAVYLHLKLRRYTDSEAAYRTAIQRDPAFARPWNGLGALLKNCLQRYEEAEDAYRRAIELDPSNAWPWNNLGNLLQYHLDRYEEAESAYRRAIDLDPSYAWPWIGLGNLYCDALHRFQDADDAFTKAMDSEATRISALLNRIFLQRDFLGDPEAARRLMESVPDDHSAWFHDTFLLHQAVFCAYDQNWGLAAERLEQALDQLHDGLPAYTADDWSRTAAVLLHLNYGQPMLSLLEKRGDERRLRPFYEAVRAHVGGDRRLLLNIAVEVRQAAEWIFDQIALRRRWLPESTMAKRE